MRFGHIISSLPSCRRLVVDCKTPSGHAAQVSLRLVTKKSPLWRGSPSAIFLAPSRARRWPRRQQSSSGLSPSFRIVSGVSICWTSARICLNRSAAFLLPMGVGRKHLSAADRFRSLVPRPHSARPPPSSPPHCFGVIAITPNGIEASRKCRTTAAALRLVSRRIKSRRLIARRMAAYRCASYHEAGNDST